MKPVAWIIQSKYGFPALVWNGEPIKYNAISAKQDDIPLYTAPRELSNDEIDEVASDFSELYESEARVYAAIEDAHGFARAILKKVEKK